MPISPTVPGTSSVCPPTVSTMGCRVVLKRPTAGGMVRVDPMLIGPPMLSWLPGEKNRSGAPSSFGEPGACVMVRPSSVNPMHHK